MFRRVVYTSTTAELRNLFAKKGDADVDKDVDITDFNILAANFDPSGLGGPYDWAVANFDADNDVDITDFNSLAANFAPSGYGSSHAVPEPSSILLGFLGLLGASCIALRHISHGTTLRP